MMDFSTATNDKLDAEIIRIDRGQVGALDYQEFLNRKIPPRQCLLTPWLPMAGLAMIHAPRGIGKTHIALGTAWAVAVGGGFLKWKVPDDVGCRRVLMLDGEMPGALLQERLRGVTGGSELTPAAPEYLRIAAADLRRDGLPDLADPAAQQFYADIIADADLVIVDNLSTLCRGLKENDADSWTPVQSWLLAQRRAGKSVLVIHHGGKSGQQRGTSRKEDVLDSVVALRKPPDYQADQGARFEIHFEKSRGFFGPEAEPFEARKVGNQWELSDIKSGDDDETLQVLHKQGLSVRDIADRTGLSKSSVQRRLEGGRDDQ
jgi:putative DNA primase/helicase